MCSYVSTMLRVPTLNICLPRKNKNERASEGIGRYYELRRKIFIRMSKIAPASRYIQCFWPAMRKRWSKKQKRDPPGKISYLPPNTLHRWTTNNPIALAVLPTFTFPRHMCAHTKFCYAPLFTGFAADKHTDIQTYTTLSALNDFDKYLSTHLPTSTMIISACSHYPPKANNRLP